MHRVRLLGPGPPSQTASACKCSPAPLPRHPQVDQVAGTGETRRYYSSFSAHSPTLKILGLFQSSDRGLRAFPLALIILWRPSTIALSTQAGAAGLTSPSFHHHRDQQQQLVYPVELLQYRRRKAARLELINPIPLILAVVHVNVAYFSRHPISYGFLVTRHRGLVHFGGHVFQVVAPSSTPRCDAQSGSQTLFHRAGKRHRVSLKDLFNSADPPIEKEG